MSSYKSYSKSRHSTIPVKLINRCNPNHNVPIVKRGAHIRNVFDNSDIMWESKMLKCSLMGNLSLSLACLYLFVILLSEFLFETFVASSLLDPLIDDCCIESRFVLQSFRFEFQWKFNENHCQKTLII